MSGLYTYTCPVCGYDQLNDPPVDYNICPSCGTEFGYHDFTKSWDQLRSEWVAKGSKWLSKHIPAPANWKPYRTFRVITASGNTFHQVIMPSPRTRAA